MGDNKKVANSVVALSSAAVLAIYGAGYARTKAAADRFAQQAAERRPHIPASRSERDAVSSAQPPSAPATIAVTEATIPIPAPTERDSSRDSDAATTAREKTSPDAPRATEPAQPRVADANGVTRAIPDAVRDTRNVPEAAATIDDESPATPAQAPAQVPAPAPVPAVPPAPAPPPKPQFKDGTYYGWGTSRHGDIQAAVVVEDGKITVARVERCLTRYSCNWIEPIPPRILSKQGTTYDYVSGATESSDAFQDAVAEALSQAK